MSDIKTRLANRMIKDVLIKILKCSELMVRDLLEKNQKIKNHEEYIRNHLYAKYLNNNNVLEKVNLQHFIFISEDPENYVAGQPKGRVDLKVFSRDIFTNRQAYFVIEFKRIDGKRPLNRAYVTKGVNRFIDRDNLPLYSSYYGRSCMFGFVVKNIDIEENLKQINEIHRKENDYGECASDIKKHEMNKDFPHTYVSTYPLNHKKLTLDHLFFDFSSIV